MDWMRSHIRCWAQAMRGAQNDNQSPFDRRRGDRLESLGLDYTGKVIRNTGISQ